MATHIAVIDPLRLSRAVHLDVDRMADGRYLVTGGNDPHVVDPDTGNCNCPDHALGNECKHVLRVRLAAVDAETIRALRRLVPAPSGTRGPSLRGFVRKLRHRSDELAIGGKSLAARITANVADQLEAEFFGRSQA